MNFEDLYRYIQDHGTPTGPQLRSLEFREFRLDVERETAFLDDMYPGCNISMKIRLEVIASGVPQPPKCSQCGENYVNSVNQKRFSSYCSDECMRIGRKKKTADFYEANPHKKAEKAEKAKKTNLDRYGVEWTLQDPKVRQKAKETSISKYGTEYPRQNADVAKAMEDKFFEKHGVRNPSNLADVQEKRKKTFIERYGCENPSSTDEVKHKRRDTVLSRYGVDHVMKAQCVKEKQRETMVERYGVEFPLQVDEFLEKAKNTNLERYGCEYSIVGTKRQETLDRMSVDYGHTLTSPIQSMMSPSVVNTLRDRSMLEEVYGEGSIQHLADSLGVSYTTTINALHAHGIAINKQSRSQAEKELEEMIRELGFDVVCNDRTTFGVEVDLYIPEANLAIEFNGIYWHSSIFKEPRFHQNKSLIVAEKGEKLIHVWEDDWLSPRKQIVVEKIKASLGLADRVFARKTRVVDVSTADAREFFDKAHIQGFKASTVYYGLLYDSEVIYMIGMSKVGGSWKIDRVASTKQIVGGFSKLLAHFKKNHDWEEITTYASLDYGHGSMYAKVGFDNNGITPPGMWFTDGRQKRIPRQAYMKHKLYDLFDDYDGQHVNDFLEGKGIHRVYDAGSVRYRMTNSGE